jgi:hypothetical protein
VTQRNYGGEDDPLARQLLAQIMGRHPQRTEIDEELRRLLVRPDATTWWHLADPPPDPHGAPTVIGPPAFERAVADIFGLVPELRGRLNRVQTPQTGGAEAAWRTLKEGEDLAGVFNPMDKSVWVKSTQSNEDIEESLIHELGHAVGYPHDRNMINLEGLVKMRQDLRNLPKEPF